MTAPQGSPSAFSLSAPHVQDFGESPSPAKVNCVLEEFIAPDFIDFAFVQGDSRVIFQQALPKHSLVLYLITVL